MTSSTVGGANRSYTYNGDGLLASATSGVTTTSELFDPSRAPAPLLLTGTTRLVYGLAPLYADSGTATTTFARDGLGSVRAEVSATGAVSNAFRYAAYGRLVQSVGGAPATLGYAGELADPTGLIYLRARWYDPAGARLVTRDPYRGNPTEPASLNGFIYGKGCPSRFGDPLGLDPAPTGQRRAEVSGRLAAPHTAASNIDMGACLVSLLAFEALSTGALAMEVAGLTLQGASVIAFGVTFGAATPISVGGIALGALLEIGGAATETFAVYLLVEGCSPRAKGSS